MTTFLMVSLGILMLSASLAFGGIGFWLFMKGYALFYGAVEYTRHKKTSKEKKEDNAQ